MYAKDFRHRAWSKLSGKWVTFLLICLIASLISGACGSISTFSRSNEIIGAVFSVIGFIVSALVGGPLELGVSACFLKLVRGQHVEIGNMFDGFKNFVKGFVLQLINSIFIALWTLLFIIPGIIKAYSYSMSFYILSDNPEMEANAARKKSMEMMHGYKWRLFCLDFSFIGWYILCILTLGILTLWVVPYHNAARAEFYQNLLDEKNGGNANSQQPDFGNNGGSVFGTGYGSENGADNGAESGSADNTDPYPEFSSDNRNEETFTKGNDEPPLDADDL